MSSLMDTIVTWAARAAAGVFLLLAVLLGISAWATWPYSRDIGWSVTTFGHLLNAPFADRVVIGDSRVEWAMPTEGSRFMGYGGATTRDLARLANVACSFGSAPVTIALGVNDTKPEEQDAEATQAAMNAILQDCAHRDLSVSAIWPVEPERFPEGDFYDSALIARYNAELRGLSERYGARFIDVPVLPDPLTWDGVHFEEKAMRLYAATLAPPGG